MKPAPVGELRRLADAVRSLAEVMPRSVATDSDVSEAADLVQKAAAIVGDGAPAWNPELPVPGSGATYPPDYFPFSPVIGLLNPFAPPITFDFVDGAVTGTARFTAPYQGPPGCVHGGVIAEFFDELLGAANMAAGNGALTGKLTVRYRSTTPLYTDLRFEGRSLAPQGRKVHAHGSLWAGERLCAEAEGIFVMVDYDKFLEITVGPHNPG